MQWRIRYNVMSGHEMKWCSATSDVKIKQLSNLPFRDNYWYVVLTCTASKECRALGCNLTVSNSYAHCDAPSTIGDSESKNSMAPSMLIRLVLPGAGAETGPGDVAGSGDGEGSGAGVGAEFCAGSFGQVHVQDSEDGDGACIGAGAIVS